jgi:ferredoxin-NADP reductase
VTALALPAYQVPVVGREWLNDEAYVLICGRPDGFNFQAGQYVALAHGVEEREYTLVSPPAADELRFLIKRVESGRLSGALAELVPGSWLGMSRARGYLTCRATERPMVFVANGVGIAPFVAMAGAGVSGFTLLHGARTVSGFYFREMLATAAARYIPCLSGPGPPGLDLPELFRGRVTGWAERSLQPGEYDVYLCGSRSMITAMTLLLDERCPQARIFSEAYT